MRACTSKRVWVCMHTESWVWRHSPPYHWDTIRCSRNPACVFHLPSPGATGAPPQPCGTGTTPGIWTQGLRLVHQVIWSTEPAPQSVSATPPPHFSCFGELNSMKCSEIRKEGRRLWKHCWVPLYWGFHSRWDKPAFLLKSSQCGSVTVLEIPAIPVSLETSASVPCPASWAVRWL